MSEKKKSFQEFLANEKLNPGVYDDKLQKVDVGARDVAQDKECKDSKTAVKAGAPKIKKKPVGLFFLLGVVFLGLTIGLSFVSLWALFGIIPTLLCWWKMVLNNGDNNLKSVVDRYDSDYLEHIDSKEKERQRCQEMEEELEEKKEEERKKTEAKWKEEEEVEENKVKKERKDKKSSKTKDEDEDEVDDFDDDEEEDEEEKKNKKAEKSDKMFGSRVERSSKKNVENEKSRTSLDDKNKRIRGQRAMD